MANYDNDLDTLSLAINRFMRSESYCLSWHENAKDWYERFRFYKHRSQYPYKHNVKDRLTFTMVEVLTAKIIQTVFAVQPFLSVVPVEKGDLEIAKQLERVVDVLLADPDREFFLEFVDFVKQNLIYGTSYLSITPRFNLKNWQFEGLNFDCEDYQDVFPDPACKRLTRAKFIVKRSIRYWDDLKELEKEDVYKNVDLIKGNVIAEYDNVVKQRLANIGMNTGIDYADDLTGEIEILDYFEEGRIITIGARKVVLRDTKRDTKKIATINLMGKAIKKVSTLPQYLPIVDSRFVPIPREFFGIGVPEILTDDQEYLDMIRSQILDNLEMINNKMFKMRIGSDIDPDTVYSAPGQIIPVTNMDDIDEFKISDISQSAWQMLDSIISRGEDAVGQYAPGRGVQVSKRETATGIVKLQQAADVRPDLVIKILEFSGIRSIGKKAITIIRQFMPQAMYERILNEPDAGFYKYSTDDIFSVLDVIPHGASITADKETRAMQIQEAQNMMIAVDPQRAAQNNPPFAVNLKKVYDMGLEALDVKNRNEILVDVQPPPQQPQQPPQGQPQPQQPSMDQYTQAMQQQPQQPQMGFNF